MSFLNYRAQMSLMQQTQRARQSIAHSQMRPLTPSAIRCICNHQQMIMHFCRMIFQTYLAELAF